jgi:DNA polymerase-1
MSLFGGIDIPGAPDLENCRKLDLLPLPMIRRAHRVGFAIDPPHFHELTSRFNTELTEREREIAEYIPPEAFGEFIKRTDTDSDSDDETDSEPEFNAGSPEQIGKLLWEILGIGSDKKLKRTRTGRISTGKRSLELVRLSHPVVPVILRYRELRTLVKNYTVKLPRLAVLHKRAQCCDVCELKHDTDQWRVHGEMGTTRAETGRINHKNPNLGNVPIRTEDGQLVLNGFVAPPGRVLVKRDLSQIELRGLAHLSNCRSMIEVYEADGDIHDDTCYKVPGFVPAGEKPDKIKHRMAAKRVNFGIQNGTTEKGLFMQLVMDFGASKVAVPEWLTEDWCKWFIEQWLDGRPEVRDYFDLQHYRARRYGLVWTTMGRVRLVPEVQSTHRWIKEAGLRQAQNLPVTGLAADQLKIAMGKTEWAFANMRESGVSVEALLTIHDAIMAECDEGEDADTVIGALQWAMDTVMEDEETGEHRFRVPIKSDGSISSRWEKG